MTEPNTVKKTSNVTRMSAGLLAVQSLLFAHSIPWNSVTFDEVQHLPAGISYWQKGTFFSYQHNPPVTKLLFAIPAVLSNVPMTYANYYYEPGSRHSDYLFGNDFTRVNRNRYQSVFVRCRFVSAALAVLGGWVVFRWTREMFGAGSALLSQALWTFCPMVLAHGGLVTPDNGSTVIGLIATYLFWKYLRDPVPIRLVASGVALGLAVGAKFPLVVLPPIFGMLAILAFLLRNVEQKKKWTWRVFCLDAAVFGFISLLTLNTVFLFEGSGIPLGRYKFFSTALTKPSTSGQSDDLNGGRSNRFTNDIWMWLPIPFPKHFLLGLDQQMYDTRPGEAYLGGEMRIGTGWWHYYLYAFIVKTPIGTIILLAFAVLSLLTRLAQWIFSVFDKSSPIDQHMASAKDQKATNLPILNYATLLLPVAVILVILSHNTMINRHARYMLQIYPFLFILIGSWAQNGAHKLSTMKRCIAIGAVVMNIVSVVLVSPFYLTYFNEFAGGPRNGYKHLIDSNIDWGQGLVALRLWLDENAIKQEIQLAYFGNVNPNVYGIRFSLPELLSASSTPRPGLHIISVNYVAGSSVPPISPLGGRHAIPTQGYRFYQLLEPKATIANCFHVYVVTPEQVERLRAVAGHPLQPDTNKTLQ